MANDRRFTVDAALEAAERDRLGEWVAAFLRSPGSDNGALAEQLSTPRRWWLGPLPLPLRELHRLAGPPGEPVLCPVDEDDWRDDVDDMKEEIEEGWEPPPLVVTYQDGALVLEDGNHRVEGLRRAGAREGWAVVGFEDREQRGQFAASHGDPTGVVVDDP